jgi:hypothetical protein
VKALAPSHAAAASTVHAAAIPIFKRTSISHLRFITRTGRMRP